MSSRAAAGRKRITKGEPPKRPSSSKGGLFSRSKANLVPAQDVIPPTPEHSPPLPPVTPFVDYHHARPSSPYLHAPDGRLGPADGGLSRRPGYASPPVTLVSSRSGGMDSGGFHSVYPAVQQIQVQSQEPPSTAAHYTRHGSSARNGARGNVYGEYQQDAVTFVEATYQPPPPIQASYQPPPPTSSLAYEDSRPHAPHRRDQPIIGGDLKKFAVPPSYGPPTPPSSSQLSLPSPHSSPPHISRQLHGSSPTPTELPTYSLSGRDSYTSARFERPSLQVAIEDTFHVPQSHSHNRGVDYHHPHHDHFGGHVPYPSPPSSQHPHLSPGPSPFNAPLSLSPSQSATSLSSDYDPRRPVYRGLGLATSSNPPSPHEQYSGGGLHGGFQISPTPSRAAPSLSGSSDSAESTSSGGRTGSGAGTGAAPPPTFFFPGSRSVAKPKISKKTGTPALIKIKSKKSKTDEVASSPVAAYDAPDTPTPTPNAHAHYLQTQTPPSPGIVGPDGQVLLVPPPRRPRHPDSVISDTMSFRSQESNAGSSRSAGSGPTTPNTPSVHSNGNGKPAPPPIIFPVGRSRAQPSKVPQGIKLKSFKTRPRTSSSASGGASVRSGNSEEQQPQASSSRARFMGIPLTRKKKSFKASDTTGTESVSSGSSVAASTIGGGSGGAARPGSYQSTASSASGSTTSQGAAAGISAAADASDATESRPRIKSRVGTYPLDPYDTVLLDNDRHTGELLYRLNPTGSPSFHNYGNAPPMSVLDLGCGQGHWVVDAAIAWKGYGTRVTGYDMVDVSKGLLPWAIEQGVVNNVRFIRGNFLKQRLPFSDDSFDLVRMSCLALCIAVDSWPFVLQEVCRVLEPGGRLELIDDSIVFPYGKFSEAPSSSTHVVSVPPKLDITIPSASFSTFSIYDERTLNPGLGTSIHESDDEDAEEPYGLYNVDEDEGEVDDTATLNGREAERTITPVPSRHSGRRRREKVPAISARAWNRAHATSGDLEALFEHMLAHKFGIRPDLNEFILGLMKDIFGHAREVKTMNLTLAPPEPTDVNHVLMSPLNTTGRPTHPFRREHMGLSQSPGLVLWPSTFLPMDQPEIEIHVSKHMRILLSCKDFLVEHALEATEDEEIDEESVLEALWEYERFLRHRFNAPPPWRNSGSSKYSGDISDAASLRESIAESVSSDARADIFEIASEIGQRFEWQLSEESLIDPERMTLRAPSPPAATLAPPPLAGNPRRDSALSIPSPIYSRDELTHVRTFRVYEAIKLDRSILGL